MTLLVEEIRLLEVRVAQLERELAALAATAAITISAAPMQYTRVLNRGGRGVVSPPDR